jgi:uncharacterized protein DUF5681
LATPDLDLIKQGEQGVRDRRGRFARGRSGNPAGRPRGCRDHANRAARLLLAGGGEALTRKAVGLALTGDPTALRQCLCPLALAADHQRTHLILHIDYPGTAG